MPALEEAPDAALDSATHIPIAELSPNLEAPASRSVKAVVTLAWPFSSATGVVAFLLAEPDFRLRRSRGQVRVQFAGPCARRVARSHISSGDEVCLSLDGVEWIQDADQAATPGRGVEFELRFTERVLLKFRQEDSQESTLLDIDHPPPESELPVASVLPDAIPEFALPLNGENGTNGTAHAKRNLDEDDDTIYSSPAFVKRSRTSYGSMFELDPFTEDDGTVAGKGRKRTRLSSVWRYTSRSPTPEREVAPAEQLVDGPIATPPRPIMLDEGCQTTEIAMDDAAEALASFSRQATNIGSMSYPGVNIAPESASQSLSSLMPPPSIQAHEGLSVTTRDFPLSPRLQPLSSEGLPLVSPLISRGLGFSANHPTQGLEPSNGDGFHDRHILSLKVGQGGVYGSSVHTRNGALSIQANDLSPKSRPQDHFMAPELYEELDESNIMRSEDKEASDDECIYVEEENDGNVDDQDESPSSSAHQPLHTQYPDLDDLPPRTNLWGIAPSSVAYPDLGEKEIDREAHPRPRASTSVAMSRSQSGQSQAHAVDLSESSDDEADLDEDDEADFDEDDDADGEVEGTSNDTFKEEGQPNPDQLRVTMAQEDSDAVGSDIEGFEYDGGYDESPENSEDAMYYNPDVDMDGNYLDRRGNVISGPGHTYTEAYKDSYGSDEGSFADEEEESDCEESLQDSTRPPAAPVFIDLLSSDDEDEEPGHAGSKASKPETRRENAGGSSDDEDGESRPSVAKVPHLGAQHERLGESSSSEDEEEDEDEISDEEEDSDSKVVTTVVASSPKVSEQRSDELALATTKVSYKGDHQYGLDRADDEIVSGIPISSLSPQGLVDQETSFPEEPTEVVVEFEVAPDTQNGEDSQPPPSETLEVLSDPGGTETVEGDVDEGVIEENPNATGHQLPRKPIETDSSTLPTVVVEQLLDLSGHLNNECEEEIKITVEKQDLDAEVRDQMEVDSEDLEAQATSRQAGVHPTTIAVENTAEDHEQQNNNTLEEQFAEVVTEAIDEALDEEAEEAIGETLEEEFAEIVSEAVEEAVEEVMAAQDHSHLISDTNNDDRLQLPRNSAEQVEERRGHSPATETTEHNAHFTRSKGPAHPPHPHKKHSLRKSHGFDGAMDEDVRTELVASPQPAEDNKQLPTPADTRTSQKTPSIETSFTSIRDSQGPIDVPINTQSSPASSSKLGNPPKIESTDTVEETSSLRITRARGRIASSNDIGENLPGDAIGGTPLTQRAETPNHATSSQRSTVRAESEMSLGTESVTNTSPRRSHRRAKSTTSAVDARELRSKASSTLNTKENIRPQTPVKSKGNTSSIVNKTPGSFPTVILDQRLSPAGHDASVELALSSLQSPSKAQTAPMADLKARLSRHLRTKLSEFTALKVLRFHLGKKLDVLAIATTSPLEPQRAKGGPRHYQVFFNITDPSVAPSGVVQVQVSRPYKDALPIIQAGDGILLRNFKVASISRGFTLQSDQTGASSWAVFKDGDEVEVRGPPVEYGDEEKDHISQLRRWYGTLNSTEMAKINRANADKGMSSPGGKL